MRTQLNKVTFSKLEFDGLIDILIKMQKHIQALFFPPRMFKDSSETRVT